MKINVGCGEFPAPGWLNLDLTHPAADLAHDATTGLPDSVQEPITRIYAGHVFEHIEKFEVIRTAERWRSHPSVTDETKLAVVGPDCDIALEWLQSGRLTQDEYDVMESGGARRWKGDSHLWRATGEETGSLLTEAGWMVTHPYDLGRLSNEGWPVTSLIGWQFALLCTPSK